MKSPAELLAEFQDDNLRLIRENLRLRDQRRKIKRAFAAYVREMRERHGLHNKPIQFRDIV